jgi:hypothetical protein
VVTGETMELSLASYLKAYLGSLAEQVGYTEESNYSFIISETLEQYGVSTEVQATDLKKLRKLGICELWKTLLREVSMDMDISVDGSSYKRSQLYDFFSKNYLESLQEAQAYFPFNKIEVIKHPVSLEG